MKKLLRQYAFFGALLITAGLSAGCERDDPERDPNIFDIAAFYLDIDKDPKLEIEIDDFYLEGNSSDLYIPEDKPFESREFKLSNDLVTYTFVLERDFITYLFPDYTYIHTYTGTVPKSAFTADGVNTFRVEVSKSKPTVYLNDVQQSAPTEKGTATCEGTKCPPTGNPGTGACPEGTWKTPTCNGVPNKFLVYNFGPRNSSGIGDGYSSNPDCNGICSGPMVFRFKYSISGNKITYNFTSTDNITCNGVTSKPNVPNPAGPYTITYTCNSDGTLLTETANIQTGAITRMTFTKQ